ncbi:sulfite exporter TauE/SafE family protein [Leptolyngbya sp. FACHB-17]|nr:sulfite exporter TauE/SafE family protein [Leptolyngbya sp. FACHB-17]
MKILVRGLTWITAIAATSLFWISPAAAHPLGNFTINHYAGLQVAPEQITVDYVLDMAEIPAFQEIHQLDTNRNRKADTTETLNYPAEKCREVGAHLKLQVDHQPLSFLLDNAKVEFPPGVGDLATLRLTCAFQKEIESPAIHSIEVEDQLYPQRLGWREMTVASDGIPIQSNFTASSITNRLTQYPTELLMSPLDQRKITVELNPAQPASVPKLPPLNHSNQALEGRSNDAFTRLITLEKLDLSTTVLALAIAFVWGGLHALSPGHGKTIVGAYLVGSRGKAKHALFLGLTVTLTHTAGIFALGLLMLSTSHFVLTEEVYPWLSAFSGILMAGIGLRLLMKQAQHHSEHHHDHHHAHEHHHDHHHHPHSHLPTTPDGSEITWSSLLALGISGGLLPCPSALVVLLSAIALGRVGFGLALVSAFSLGLASVLTGIGLLLVYARSWFEQLPLQAPRSNLFPAASALLITLVGVGITTKALFTHTL